MKMILHVISCLELGGTETFIMNNYQALNREKIQFDFLVLNEKKHPYSDQIETLGGEIYFAIQPSAKNLIKFYKKFKSVVANDKEYYAVHCHLNSMNAFPLLCAYVCGIRKRISHSHAVNISPKSLLKKILYTVRKWVIRVCGNEFLACSKIAGETLYGKHFFNLRGKIINNGIKVENFTKRNSGNIGEIKEKFGILPENDLVLGNITRFDAIKNQKFILDVFSCILKKNADAVLLLGGIDGGSLEEIEKLIQEYGIGKNVRLIGARSDVSECLKVLDVYLFPSLFEGLGIALLEAQAAGCNCFASTNVPKETDMGLGSVEYIDLDKGADFWAERIILKQAQFKPKCESEIKEGFRKKKYTVDTSITDLLEVYGE